MTKQDLRAQMRALRQTWPNVGESLIAPILALARPHACVAGFWPLTGELDLRPALHALHAAGHRIALPQTPPRNQPLTFRLWTPGTPMIPEPFGTLRPDAPETAPDLILVPLLAFDRRNHRLGYGGGYYDRTLAAHPDTPRAGVSWAAARVDAIPTGPYDIPLPRILTERGTFTPEA